MASIYIMMINSVLRWKWEASWRQLKSSMVITTTGSRYGYLCLITQRGLFESLLLLWNLGSCRVFRLNLGERGEHFTRQLSWVAAWLLVTRVCPVYLVDELVFMLLVLCKEVRTLRWCKPRVTQRMVSFPLDLP